MRDHPRPALVVEDDPIIALTLADTLREGGADPVEICPSVECARSAVERLNPAIVVIDSRLDDCTDGWALAELLGLLGPGQPTIIFATAAPEAIPADVAALGTVLAKPFTPEALLAAANARQGEGLLGRLRGALGG